MANWNQDNWCFKMMKIKIFSQGNFGNNKSFHSFAAANGSKRTNTTQSTRAF